VPDHIGEFRPGPFVVPGMTPSFAVEHGALQPAEVHFDDLDAFRTLHHGRCVMLVDRALASYWTSKGYRSDATVSAPDAFQLVREVSITFDFPIRDYGQVLVHFCSEEVGRTSLTIGFRVVSLDGTQQYAHGRRVTVKVDPVTQRPAAWSEAGRSDLEALLRPVPETVGG
jgi:acyl-CoA thioester hydrolase